MPSRPGRPSPNPIIHPEEILRRQHRIIPIGQRANPLPVKTQSFILAQVVRTQRLGKRRRWRRQKRRGERSRRPLGVDGKPGLEDKRRLGNDTISRPSVVLQVVFILILTSAALRIVRHGPRGSDAVGRSGAIPPHTSRSSPSTPRRWPAWAMTSKRWGICSRVERSRSRRSGNNRRGSRGRRSSSRGNKRLYDHAEHSIQTKRVIAPLLAVLYSDFFYQVAPFPEVVRSSHAARRWKKDGGG